MNRKTLQKGLDLLTDNKLKDSSYSYTRGQVFIGSDGNRTTVHKGGVTLSFDGSAGETFLTSINDPQRYIKSLDGDINMSHGGDSLTISDSRRSFIFKEKPSPKQNITSGNYVATLPAWDLRKAVTKALRFIAKTSDYVYSYRGATGMRVSDNYIEATNSYVAMRHELMMGFDSEGIIRRGDVECLKRLLDKSNSSVTVSELQEGGYIFSSSTPDFSWDFACITNQNPFPDLDSYYQRVQGHIATVDLPALQDVAKAADRIIPSDDFYSRHPQIVFQGGSMKFEITDDTTVMVENIKAAYPPELEGKGFKIKAGFLKDITDSLDGEDHCLTGNDVKITVPIGSDWFSESTLKFGEEIVCMPRKN